MKIGIISTSYHPYNFGGGEISAKLLADGLKACGHEVVVIAAFKKSIVEEVDGIKVYRVKSPNLYWAPNQNVNIVKKLLWHLIELYNFNVLNSLKQIQEIEKCEILHIRNITNFSFYVWKAIKKLRVPCIMTLNNYASICQKVDMYRRGNCRNLCIRCRLTAIPKRWLSKYVDGVISVSKYTLNKHLSYGFFHSIPATVIYTSVSPQRLPLKFPLNDNDFISFGIIGRMHITKGVKELIKVFKSIDVSYRFKLIITGDYNNRYGKECQELAESDKRIIFTGKLNSSFFYNSVDIVLINSLWQEPYPRVIPESFSYLRPIVGSSMGGIKEQIINGVNGYIFEDGNYFSLLQILMNLISKPSSILHMAENIAHNYIEFTDNDLYFSRHINFYYKIKNSIEIH